MPPHRPVLGDGGGRSRRQEECGKNGGKEAQPTTRAPEETHRSVDFRQEGHSAREKRPAGGEWFSETEPLATEFRPTNDALIQAVVNTKAKRSIVLETRATVRIAEFNTESEIRSFARALQIAEGGRRGPAYHFVVPDGLNALITPRRESQKRKLRLLIERLGLCNIPAAKTAATEWIPRLTATADRFEAALANHGQAVSNHDAAFRSELGCRAEHSPAVDEMIGRVRATFPEDRARQDAVFPAIDPASPRKDDKCPGGGRPRKSG